MQIRVSPSGRKIQVLRSVYVPDKKRSTQKVVLTFPSYDDDRVPQTVLDALPEGKKLKDEEIKEIQVWLDKRKADQEDATLRYSVDDLPKSINRASQGIVRHSITADHAQAIYASIDNLTKIMRRGGLTRIKPKKIEEEKSAKTAKPVRKKKTAKKASKKIAERKPRK